MTISNEMRDILSQYETKNFKVAATVDLTIRAIR